MIAAVGALLDPVQARLSPFFHEFALRLLLALLLFLTAWMAAGIVRWIARRAVRAEWIEKLLLRSGVLSGLVEPSLAQFRGFGANLLYGGVLAFGAVLSLAIVDENLAVRLLGAVASLVPRMLAAFAILAGALWLSRYWARSILIALANEGVRSPGRWAVLLRFLVLATGVALSCEITGFAVALVRPAYLILLAGATFCLAYGLLPAVRAQMTELLFTEDDGRRKIDQPDDPLLR